MDDNGLPNNISPQQSPPKADQPVAEAISDQSVLPPLPMPGDTVPPIVSDTVPRVTPPTEPEKPKKKSNMKVVAGLMVALFLVGAAITSLVMFPNFRGDIRPKARDVEDVERYTEQQNQKYGYELTDLQRTQFQNPDNNNPYVQVTFAPVEDNNYAGDGAQVQQSAPSGGGGGSQSTGSTEDNNYSGGGTNSYCSSEMNRDCAYGCSPSTTGGSCNSAPVATTTVAIASSNSTGGNGCTGVVCPDGRRCVSNATTGYDCVDPAVTVTGAPTGVGGVSGGCGVWPVGGSECRPDGYMYECIGDGQWQNVARCNNTCSGTLCSCNQCHRDGAGTTNGHLCSADGNSFIGTCTLPDNGTGSGEFQTCGCVNGEQAGQSGPYMCWVKNGSTGAFIRQLGATITKSGCKGSGAPSVTTTATATVTTTPGGGSSSGGSSSSSSGGSSSSSSGGTAPLCVETRVYLKKADGTFDTVATPVSQLSSKVSIGNTIRLAIRGNLANFTKGRFIIKKSGTVLETKETTTKNNLPGDPATFEYIYDYTVASGGSYSIEGAVWQ